MRIERVKDERRIHRIWPIVERERDFLVFEGNGVPVLEPPE